MTLQLQLAARMRPSTPLKHISKLPRYVLSVPKYRSFSSKPPTEGEQTTSARASPSPHSGETKTQNRAESPEGSKSTERSNKTVAQSDQELREKLESMCGGGGDAALELENGKPVTMKRGVRENMFRLI